MRDLLRLSHPRTSEKDRNSLFKYITSGELNDNLPAQVVAAFSLNDESSVDEVINTITEHNLPREAVPTKFLNEVKVWEALLPSMPMTALIRNLGKMTSIGLLDPMSDATRLAVDKLSNQEAIHKARIHPINVLAAMKIYGNGQGFKGKLSWNTNQQIMDVLDDVFYSSFDAMESTGKNVLIGLDISGSMGWEYVNGMPFMTAREAAAAMSMATARVESNYHVMGFSHDFIPLNVSPRMRMDTIISNISGMPFGATDCALPMIYAIENQIPVDTFIVYTDSETWRGNIQPVQVFEHARHL
jgi:60 kDa SS-A/Ro ribonucleoprotein